MSANKLSLNVKKSNFLHFHYGKSQKSDLEIKINNTTVEEKNYTKYLGVFIDNKLTWEIQVQHIKSRLARGIGMISKIRHYVDEACLLKMFYSFVQSHINYNILNWSCTKDTVLKPIETKLKKAIRIISFAKTMYDHSDPIFKQYKILPFKQHVALRKASFMWKVVHGYVPNITTNLFTKNLHNHLKLVLPHTVNDKAKYYFAYSCVKEWTCVPDTLKMVTTFSNFTRKYKAILLDSL